MVYPGNRMSVLVKASDTPGDYFLRSMKAPHAPFPETEEVVARIRVEGAPVSVAMPAATALPAYAELAPITDAELAGGGGRTRNLVLAVLDKTDARLPQPIPPTEEWFVPVGDGADFFADLVFVSGDNAAGSVLAPFQSPLATAQTVAFNDVEEWTIHNPEGGYPHPFHIHVNDSYVVKVNGVAVTPYWADTLPVPVRGSITFRMRFTDFKGKLVWHCHALDHEDMGMMQLVEIV
jgi:FtsP/CotA-like multicopper oxidase with cupredoxin domain